MGSACSGARVQLERVEGGQPLQPPPARFVSLAHESVEVVAAAGAPLHRNQPQASNGSIGKKRPSCMRSERVRRSGTCARAANPRCTR